MDDHCVLWISQQPLLCILAEINNHSQRGSLRHRCSSSQMQLNERLYLLVSEWKSNNVASQSLWIVGLFFAEIVHTIMSPVLRLQKSQNFGTWIAEQPCRPINIALSHQTSFFTLTPLGWISHRDDMVRHITQIQIESVFCITRAVLGHNPCSIKIRVTQQTDHLVSRTS